MGYKVINKRNELVDLYSDFSGEINPGITKVRCDIGLAQGQKYSEQIIAIPNFLSLDDGVPLIGEFDLTSGASSPVQIGMEMQFPEGDPTELHIYLGRDGGLMNAINGYVVVYFFSGDIVRSLKMFRHLWKTNDDDSCTDWRSGYKDIAQGTQFYSVTTLGMHNGIKILGISESLAFDNFLRTSPGLTYGIEGFVNEYGSLAGRIAKYSWQTILGTRDIESVVALTTLAEESYVVRSDKALIPLYTSDNRGVIRFIDFDVPTTLMGFGARAIIPIPFSDVNVNCIALSELKPGAGTIPLKVYYDSNSHNVIINICPRINGGTDARQIRGTIACFTEG